MGWRGFWPDGDRMGLGASGRDATPSATIAHLSPSASVSSALVERASFSSTPMESRASRRSSARAA
jgi:hypothetical protein